MECVDYRVDYPKKLDGLDQNEEWITLTTDSGREEIRLHDYGRFFEVPGLYEDVVYKRLKCNSPSVVCQGLKTAIGGRCGDLKVLDFGAGNGIVGECIRNTFPCDMVVGLDIIPEARAAAERDRPGVYEDYYVLDLSQMDVQKEGLLKKWNFNTLVTVAALGYGDIPAQAFINAFNLIENGGWVAFNIKDRFLSDDDETGFRETIDKMMGDSIEISFTKRYRHRLSLAGESLYYHAIAGKKLKNVSTH